MDGDLHCTIIIMEFPSVHMVPRHYGIRTERFKLMHFYEFGEEWEFYDLQRTQMNYITSMGNLGTQD